MWTTSEFHGLPVLVEKNFLENSGVEVIFTLAGAGDMSLNSSDSGHLKNFSPIVLCKQIHGAEAQEINSSNLPSLINADENPLRPGQQIFTLKNSEDALITTEKGLGLGIRTADCAPVMLFSTLEKKIAALHVGRKGALKGIIEKVITRFFKSPEEILAAIGPHIRKCCYRFSDEDVVTQFGRFYSDGKIDLTGYIKDKLINRCGIKEENISIANHCTYCGGEDKFFSYKRSGGKEKARHLSLIRIKK